MNTRPDPSHSIAHCPQCGVAIEGDAPEGLCPRCLLRLARDFSELDFGDWDSESSLTLGHFADYELLAEIGHGGMGVVYQARQKSLDRIVALKMLLGGQFAEPQARARFRSEAEITAQLQHPNIVAIHEVGEHDHLPFFTMGYVEGRSLAEVARDKPLTPASAAGYLSTIARAIAYAHERGVLHRDLKPSNILIDGSDQPRITDFGLAKRLTGSTTSLTLSGEALGSPNFMPPEQAAGRHKEIGPPSDVYGLGAILYYLVTSRPPFVADNLSLAVRQVQDQEPVSPRMLNPGVPKDLETICLKCLQKEPTKRYATAADLADELDRFRRGEPIQARPVGPAGRVWRWCQRRPALAALAAAVALLAVISTTVALRMTIEREGRERERYRANIQLAAAQIEEGSIDVALETLLDCPERFRHWEWGYLVAQCHREVLTLDEARDATRNGELEYLLPGGGWRCGFSRDGTRLGTIHPGGTVQVWEFPSGKPLWSLREQLDPKVGIVWLPDWSGVVLARSNTVELVRAGHPDTRRPLEGHAFNVQGLALSSDGLRVAAVAANDMVRIWDATDGRELAVFRVIPGCESLFFTGDGGRLVVSAKQEAAAYDARTGLELLRMSSGQEGSLAVMPDSETERFLTAGPPGDNGISELKLWSANGLVQVLGAGDWIDRPRVIFRRDRSAFCISGISYAAAVRDSLTGATVLNIPVRVNGGAFSHDGQRLATHGGTSTIHIWDPTGRRELMQLKGHKEAVHDVAFSPDGRLLASVSAYGSAKVWSALPGREIHEHTGLPWGLAHTSDGRRMANAFHPYQIALRDTQSGRLLARLRRVRRGTQTIALSPDDRHLAVGDLFGEIAIWEIDSGRLLRTWRAHELMVLKVGYSRDGRFLGSAGYDGTIRIWDPDTARRLLTLEQSNTPIESFDFSPDSRRLAVSDNKIIRLWNLENGRCEREFHGHSEQAYSVLFTPDGRTLITSGLDNTLRTWDPDSGETLACWNLRGLAGALAMSPDGRRLALRVTQGTGFGTDAPTLELRDFESGRQLLTFRGFVELGSIAGFSPDGRHLVTDWWDSKLRQREAFPWVEADYPGLPSQPLRERLRTYAHRYWQERLEAERGIADTNATLFVEVAFDRSRIPQRDPATPRNLVDLTEHYTGVLSESSHLHAFQYYFGVDLRNAPTGLVNFHNVLFDLRGLIQTQLQSIDPLWWDYPRISGPIHIGQPCRKLHSILGSSGRAPEGETIGAFVLHYADGSQHELEVVYGRHVRHWWTHADPRTDTDLARVAWEGPHAAPHIHPTRLRMFHAVWDNPRPDQEIVSFDFVSKLRTTAAPFLIAVTLE